MRLTAALFQHPLRLTLFTRANCSLCDSAKAAVKAIRRDFDYDEVDILREGAEHWKSVYEFDVPVVCELNMNFIS